MAFGDVVRFQDNSFASGEVSFTFTGGAAALGNLLVVGEGRSATHSVGGAWGPPAGWNIIQESGINAGNMAAAWYWKISDGTETAFVSAHTNEQGNAGTIFAEFEGPFAAVPLDVSAEDATHLASVVTSQSTGTTAATAQNDELALAFFATDRFDTSDGTRVYTNSFTEVAIADGAAARATAIICKLVLSATGTQECTFSVTDTGDEMYGSIATFKKSVGGGDTALVVADVDHAHTAEDLALTQAFVLTVADASHATGSENLALTQAHMLAIADVGHTHAVDSPALIQAFLLVLSDVSHNHDVENLSLVQAYLLAVADSTHAHAVDPVVLVQQFLLAVADAAHSHESENVDLQSGLVLAIQNVEHAHAVENLALTQAQLLVIQDVAHAHAVETFALIQDFILLVADANHAHTAGSVILIIGLPHHIAPSERVIDVAADDRGAAVDADARIIIVGPDFRG